MGTKPEVTRGEGGFSKKCTYVPLSADKEMRDQQLVGKTCAKAVVPGIII